MSIFSILVALLVLSVLVVVHEFGHYCFAKLNGICVLEFSIGLGPKLLSKQIGETLYSIRLLPLGGFCRMLGEEGEVSDPRSFNNKGVWARISVVVAGPLMNFVFALIVIVILLSKNGFNVPEIASFVEGTNAVNSGLEIGDKIVAINDKKVSVYQDVLIFMDQNDGSAVDVTVKRDGKKYTYHITPTWYEKQHTYLLGINPGGRYGMFSEPIEGFEQANMVETIQMGFRNMTFFIRSTVSGFFQIFTFKADPEEISGPIGIIEVMSDSYESGLKYSVWAAIENMLSFAALLSTNLGALNLFPIPAMDGGRLVFLFLELIRKKPVDPAKEGFVHFAGFVLLMMFMVVIAYNDIVKLF